MARLYNILIYNIFKLYIIKAYNRLELSFPWIISMTKEMPRIEMIEIVIIILQERRCKTGSLQSVLKLS